MSQPHAILWSAFALLLTACGDAPAPTADAFPVPTWAKVAPEQLTEAAKHGVPVALENDLGMRFVLIPAGTFLMGSPEDEEGRTDQDLLRHEVTIREPYYLQVTEVTNEQYEAFDPKHESGNRGLAHWLDWPDMPVVRVAHERAVAFAAWLSNRDVRRSYRLPTEPEWERACRAGTSSRYWWGNSEEVGHVYANAIDKTYNDEERPGDEIPEAGWLGSDGHYISANVGSYLPNPFGLHDMLGNAAEFCAHDEELHGRWYCARGGSFESPSSEVRCASRRSDFGSGFRLVSPLPAPNR